MGDNKWGELINRIDSQFGILENNRYDLEEPQGAFVEEVIFEGPMGKMKLERTTKPRVVGEKAFGGSKYGAASGVEKVYSEDEVVNVMKVYKEVGDEWQEADEGMFG